MWPRAVILRVSACVTCSLSTRRRQKGHLLVSPACTVPRELGVLRIVSRRRKHGNVGHVLGCLCSRDPCGTPACSCSGLSRSIQHRITPLEVEPALDGSD